MAINWKLIETQLDIIFTKKRPSNERDAAKSIADAYEIGMLSATTMLQNSLLTYNKAILQSNLESAFLLARATSKLNMKLVASGFVGFWAGSQFSPLPPHPPTILPMPIPTPCVVVFPGDINSLEVALKASLMAFSGKTTNITIQSMILALRTHTTTINGVYNGLVPSPTGPIPSPPIPWVGIF